MDEILSLARGQDAKKVRNWCMITVGAAYVALDFDRSHTNRVYFADIYIKKE